MPEEEVETYSFCSRVINSVFAKHFLLQPDMDVRPPLDETADDGTPSTPSTSTTIPPRPTAYTPPDPLPVPDLVGDTAAQQYVVMRLLRRGAETPNKELTSVERKEWKELVKQLQQKYYATVNS